MKNAFNDRPDMAEKENSELENMTRETPITEKQREKIEGEGRHHRKPISARMTICPGFLKWTQFITIVPVQL